MRNFLRPFTVINLSNISIRLICAHLIKIRFFCRLICPLVCEFVNVDNKVLESIINLEYFIHLFLLNVGAVSIYKARNLWSKIHSPKRKIV